MRDALRPRQGEVRPASRHERRPCTTAWVRKMTSARRPRPTGTPNVGREWEDNAREARDESPIGVEIVSAAAQARLRWARLSRQRDAIGGQSRQKQSWLLRRRLFILSESGFGTCEAYLDLESRALTKSRARFIREPTCAFNSRQSTNGVAS
jgi:hypothetical protein